MGVRPRGHCSSVERNSHRVGDPRLSSASRVARRGTATSRRAHYRRPQFSTPLAVSPYSRSMSTTLPNSSTGWVVRVDLSRRHPLLASMTFRGRSGMQSSMPAQGWRWGTRPECGGPGIGITYVGRPWKGCPGRRRCQIGVGVGVSTPPSDVVSAPLNGCRCCWVLSTRTARWSSADSAGLRFAQGGS